MKQKKFIIIDGNALLHRAWHAIPPLRTKEGVFVNAAFGFTSILLKVIKDLKPDYLAVTFDVAGKTFRHEMYDDYKAHREKKPDDLYEQIPIIKEIVKSLNIPIFEKSGYEADDLIGTLSNQDELKEKGIRTVIVTGDLDTLQLVDDHVFVYTFRKGIHDTIIYDHEKVHERYQLDPNLLIEMKAMAGDSSDNIKGIPSIGIKTATNLIHTFGSIENMYQELESEKESEKVTALTDRVKNLLKEWKDDALMARELVTIKRDVDIDFKLEETKFEPKDKDDVLKTFQKYEFKTLLTQLNVIPFSSTQGELFASLINPHQKKVISNYHLIENKKSFDTFLKKLNKEHFCAIEPIVSISHPVDAYLIGLGFCFKEGEAHYLHLGIISDNLSMDQQYYLKHLKLFFENRKIGKYGHHIKILMEVLRKYDIELETILFDTLICSYLTNPGSRAHDLDKISFSELGIEIKSVNDLLGSGKKARKIEELESKELSEVISMRADMIYRLIPVLEKELKEKKQLNIWEEIELPLINVLANMEMNGVSIDVEFFNNFSERLTKRIHVLEKKIFDLSGEEFNINSQKQLKVILFEKLEIPSRGLKKIKTGISLAAGELEKIEESHEIIPLILEYRELMKLLSTYIDALPKLVSKQTNRIHSRFNQTVTATGRLSSSDPNLQNIPIRTELGKEVRKAFISQKGYKLISVDYSQIELRLVASLAEDTEMIQAFKDGEDIHARTAAQINEVPIDQVDSKMRYAAKAINFGIIYGQGATALSKQVGITYNEAKVFIEKYFEVRHKVKEYLDHTKEQAHQDEYVKTLYGRIRQIPEVNSKVPMIRAAGERMAINMPVQGTAADLMKIAMIEVWKDIHKNYSKEEVLMLLQVHDELVFEVREDLIDVFSKKVKDIMESVGASDLDVPIVAELKVGDNWGDMEKLEI